MKGSFVANSKNPNEVDVESLAETENYLVWMSDEPDGEQVIHVELGSVTLHFFREEWQELTKLIVDAQKAIGSGKRQ
jgi:hypothetical protein